MGGVFMKKIVKRIRICFLLAALCWSVVLIGDRKTLNEGLIRFHVVAHSDSEKDQMIKLHIRDVVLQSIQEDLQKVANIDAAREYLQENLPKLQFLVDQTLQELNFSGGSAVTFCKEPFDIRHYDTFSLPAGVYDSLRIVIGDGLGKNWWCVSFPTLCIPATASGFADVAAGAGFSESLTRTLSGAGGYEIRFFFLNQLGQLEKIFGME